MELVRVIALSFADDGKRVKVLSFNFFGNSADCETQKETVYK